VTGSNQAVRKMRQAAGPDHPGTLSEELLPLVLALYDAGCVRFWELHACFGETIAIYIDLRRVISFRPCSDRWSMPIWIWPTRCVSIDWPQCPMLHCRSPLLSPWHSISP